MTPSSEEPRELHIPEGQSIEGWLSQYDNQPRFLPGWPASQRMSLVAMMTDPHDGETAALVMTHPRFVEQIVERQLNGSGPDRSFWTLFFVIPKERILPVCPGMTLADWEKLV